MNKVLLLDTEGIKMISRTTYEKQPTKMYSFRIYTDYLEKIKIMAIEKRMSASQIMNQALAEFISGE